MLWGGLRFLNQKIRTMRLSTDLYVLDFSERRPRWRKAAVDNINVQGTYQLAFPNTGVAPLPQSGVVALMHKSVSGCVKQAIYLHVIQIYNVADGFIRLVTLLVPVSTGCLQPSDNTCS